MAIDHDDQRGSLSGLTDQEAREFHRIFMSSFIMFVVVAVIAHVLVWMWRPWFPGEKGYSALTDSVNVAMTHVLPYLT